MNFKKIFSLFALLILIINGLLAQDQEKKPNQYLSSDTFSDLDFLGKYYKQALNDKGSKNLLSGFSTTGTDISKLLDKSSGVVPMEGFINPTEYYLGPSDILEVNIWGAIPLTLPVIISPEGTAIVNTVGEIPLKGLTLEEAKITLANEIKKKFKSSAVSVTLRSPRLFNVSVVGNVNNPGTFVVSAIDRVDRVVSIAVRELEKKEILNKAELDRLAYFRDEQEKERNDYSLRNIKVIHKNGDTLNVDLVKYFAMGDKSSNPFLRDGDIIFVPKEDLDGNIISIFGAVKKPGKFEYSKGDNITTALSIAQGYNANSDLTNVEINRVNEDWSGFSKINVNLKSILDGKEKNFELIPGDRVFIRPLKSIKPTKEVTLKGEVVKPGKYPIIKGVTKLSEVIEAAGGFTASASLAEASIVRKNITEDNLEKNPDYERLETMRLGKLDRTDIEYLTLEEVIKRGYVVADFKKIFSDKDKSSDILLEGDEIIYVPTDNNSVYVYGQVNNPGYVTINGSSDYEYYIKKAGGFSESAIKGNVAVIKGGSKEWKDPDNTKIESGDIIWVPKKEYKDFTTWWSFIRDVTSIVISAGTIALIIIQIKNH
jgi:polysaccharide biosynthesis/export protein